MGCICDVLERGVAGPDLEVPSKHRMMKRLNTSGSVIGGTKQGRMEEEMEFLEGAAAINC